MFRLIVEQHAADPFKDIGVTGKPARDIEARAQRDHTIEGHPAMRRACSLNRSGSVAENLVTCPMATRPP